MFIEITANKNNRKLVYGTGINDAWYKIEIKINNKSTKCPFYKRWHHMLERCYSVKYQKNFPTYTGCSVCAEWLTFSNFKAWMIKQDWQGKCLDKDLLSQGNKVYSPDMCLFVSNEINVLLTDSKATRGIHPRGVSFNKRNNKFQSELSVNGKPKRLGGFDSPEKAHEVYKKAKYALIKATALKQLEPLKSALLAYKIV
jgi:hypothetical protein